MPKKSRKPRKKSDSGPAPSSPAKAPTRRQAIGNIALYAVGGAVLLGGGAALAVDIHNKIRYEDLSLIANGTPTVVQIHDPRCSLCAALQSQTLAALARFDEIEVNYVVANLLSEEGADYARTQGLPHVTLLLLDGDGNRMHVIQGVTPEAEIAEAIETHLGIAPQAR